MSEQRSISTGHPRRKLILAVILAAECMDLFDGTIVNVAAPSIRSDLHASSSALQWIVGGYPLAIAIGLVAGGRLGDLFGRKRMFILGALGFTVASALCAVAPTTGVLIAARLLQGLLGSLMLPQGFGILREVFPPEEISGAFAIFGPVIGSAAILGPIIGGGLVDLNLFSTGWRLCFLVNLPLGIAAVASAARLLPPTRGTHAARLDVVGAGLIALASGLLVYPLIQGRALGWPWWTYVAMGASVVVLGAFARWQRVRVARGADPLVTPSVFTHRGYSAGVVVAMVFFAGMIGVMLVVTLFVQLGEGFSAVHAGLTLAPWAFGMAAGAGLSGALLGPKFGRKVLQLGVVVSAAGMLLLIDAVHGTHGGVSTWALLPGAMLGGFGSGLVVAPMFDIILAAVEDHETGSASGVLNAAQQLAGAIGVAILGTVFFTVVGRHGDFAAALERALWVDIGMLGLMLAVTPLMPGFAREPGDEAAAIAPAAAERVAA